MTVKDPEMGRSPGLSRWALNAIIRVLISREGGGDPNKIEKGRQRQRQRSGVMCDKPRNIGSYQKLKETRN